MKNHMCRGIALYSGKNAYGYLVYGHDEMPYLLFEDRKGQKSTLTALVAGSESRFTGFQDKNGDDIYENDTLGDWNEVDGEMVQSKLMVFWSEKIGAWMLDSSFNQDNSSGDLLSDELASFSYEINNI